MDTQTAERKLLDGRYRVRSILGGGGSALVYLARHAELGRDVAIKVIRPEVFESEKEVERYLREARIVAALNHPNVVTLFDVGRLPDKRPYMVMELVAGQSMNRLLQDGAVLPVDLALHLFDQVARALGHAHRHGVIHRDIKPGNILLQQGSTGYPMVKVADFGVASVASSRTAHQGAFIGTPMYMSPEQAQGRPVVPASDLYSLGMVMYRSLTGKKPFANEAESPVAMAMSHVMEPVLPFSEVAPELDLPPMLEAVVMRCLQKDPADRYPDTDALLEALAEVRRQTMPHLIGLSQESLDPRPVTVTPPPSPWVTPGRIVVAALALAAMVLSFAIGWGAKELARRPIEVSPPAVLPAVVMPEPLPSEEAPEAELAPVPVRSPAVEPVAAPEPPPVPVADTPEPRGPIERGGQARRVVPRGFREPGEADAAVAPSVGAWRGELDGKPISVELMQTGPDGVVTARLRGRGGWNSDQLVGRLDTLGADRYFLVLADRSGKGPELALDLAEGHAWGTVRQGDKTRKLVLDQR